MRDSPLDFPPRFGLPGGPCQSLGLLVPDLLSRVPVGRLAFPGRHLTGRLLATTTRPPPPAATIFYLDPCGATGSSAARQTDGLSDTVADL